MSCLAGFFHDVHTTSLAESLLSAERGGAVGVWASSGLTDDELQAPLDRAFLAGVATLPVGDAIRAAKAQVKDGDLRRTWNLLGDPAMRLFETPPVARPGGDTDPPPPDSGCACTVGRDRATPTPLALVALALLAAIALRGRRAWR